MGQRKSLIAIQIARIFYDVERQAGGTVTDDVDMCIETGVR